MLRRLNESLPGLVLGIVIYGAVIQIAGVWFAADKLAYSIGLWYGIAIAIGSAINLASVIYDTVIYGNADYARKRAVLKSVLRYMVVVVLFMLLGFFQFGSLVMGLVGVFGLKISAYMQPLLGGISRKLIGDNWMFPEHHYVEEEHMEEYSTGEPHERGECEDDNNENYGALELQGDTSSSGFCDEGNRHELNKEVRE